MMFQLQNMSELIFGSSTLINLMERPQTGIQGVTWFILAEKIAVGENFTLREENGRNLISFSFKDLWPVLFN